ncbi:hypothetical protein [Ruegeria arenilitoris]|uniref:hypothetical protein n=1 Tax=Ruegeria arenilitoris TaxID=1173585 RepID=UPI00147A457E|nr:hypothetical protein [Ruegeria arenilitoris]
MRHRGEPVADGVDQGGIILDHGSTLSVGTAQGAVLWQPLSLADGMQSFAFPASDGLPPSLRGQGRARVEQR